ncbi:taste receptor type 1 member 1-like [Arapaima gigas]
MSLHTLSFLVCTLSAHSTQAESLSELHLSGDYSFAGMFPLHNLASTSNLPALLDCNQSFCKGSSATPQT